jgi:NCS1 family nucleobase:cation symporter-1
VAAVVTVVAYGITMWLHTGDLATKFTNVLLFITYWVTGFIAIVAIDWVRRGGRVGVAAEVPRILNLRALPWNLEAALALALGFVASMPFMDTAQYVGTASKNLLHGADLAYVVNFVVAGVLYLVFLRVRQAYRPGPRERAVSV